MGTEADDLFELFDDLEGQAEALYDGLRGAELGDRSRAEYARVTFASRVMASLGHSVSLRVRGVQEVAGVLSAAGAGWCRVDGSGCSWVVAVPAILAISGTSERSAPEVAWPATAKLGLGSALRRLDPQRICLLDGGTIEGTIERVGADFIELRTTAEIPGAMLVPFKAVAAAARRTS